MKMMSFDPKSSLNWRFDAVHGHIDIRDPLDSSRPGTITKLLKSPILERLRRIKQLGFASQSYPAADHSRYSHALGTMHIMRALLNRLSILGTLKPDLYNDLRHCFPDLFERGGEVDNEKILFLHMLIAALLQDAGELPFSQATKRIYKPSKKLRETISKYVGFDVSSMHSKEIFTIACMYCSDIKEILKKMSRSFLVFLITGKTRYDIPKNLLQLRHMMDGVVDADRLDYVFRDAHHTIGGHGSSNAVIESLLYFDEFGPVFSDPGPVSSFLATRAHLYSTVYSTPENRFHIVLLLHFLKGVMQSDTCSDEFFGKNRNGQLEFDEFLKLDDISLTTRIRQFAQKDYRKYLAPKPEKALELILTPTDQYQFFWLPRNGHSLENIARNKELTLPDDLFFDTFIDHIRQVYKPASVRIKTNSLKHYQLPMPLENCGGPFIPMFREGWSIFPMYESILLFTANEEQQQGEAWKDVCEALEEGCLYDFLVENDSSWQSEDFPTDTREQDGCTGPKIFISFASEDACIVNRIAAQLYMRRRRYCAFNRPFQGVGDTPSNNILRAIEDSDVALILASLSYCDKCNMSPNGYIGMEVDAIARKRSEGLTVVILTADDNKRIQDRFPWRRLGFNEFPFTGESLRDSSNEKLKDAIGQTLMNIDNAELQRMK